jgi:Recombination endonuclease VII
VTNLPPPPTPEHDARSAPIPSGPVGGGGFLARHASSRKRKQSTPESRAKKKVYDAAYVAANLERIRAQRRAYRASHPEPRRTDEADILRHREAAKRFRERHPERVAAAKTRYRKANKKRVEATQRAWTIKNRTRLAPLRRAADRKKKYGMSSSEFDALLSSQDHRCAICAVGISGAKAHVDHDHKTGVVRGLLCGSCNRGLGSLEDSRDRLSAALRYLYWHSHSKDTVLYRFASVRSRSDCPSAGVLAEQGWTVEHVDPRYGTRLMRRELDA